eukprot:g5498.t1
MDQKTEEDPDDFYSEDDDFDDSMDNSNTEEKKSSQEKETSIGWQNIELDDLEQGRQIGGGGFALVYKGKWRGRSVALKTLFDPNFANVKDEYFDELRVMASIKHENIVRLLGACVQPPKLYFVMELCGNTLYHLIHLSTDDLSPKLLCNWAADVASALNYLHTLRPSITHRDLKSQNVLLSRNGRSVKLCDFGLVSTRKKAAGTPQYMAPELIEERSFNCSVDVYAFGIMLWEMFTRQVPFDGWDPFDIIKKVVKGERPEIPETGCPTKIKEIIKECWKHEASQRPSSGSLVHTLRNLAKNLRDVTHVKEMKMGGVVDSLDALLLK